MDNIFNGKQKFRMWASKNGQHVHGKTFHLNPAHMPYFLKTLRASGWDINQIRKVKVVR